MFQRWVGGKAARVLSWWCFNPGIAMEEFAKLGVQSVILTSGTLSPLDSFAFELNLWGFNYSIMPFFVCNCVTFSCASLGWRVYRCSVTLPQGKNSAGRVTNCCYVIVGLARRLSFLQIHVLCGEHPYSGLLVISTNFLCRKKTDHLMCGWRIPMSLMPTRFGWVLSPWAPLDDPSILHTELVIPLSTSLSLAIQLVRVTKETHSESSDEEFFPHLNMKSNWVWSNWVLYYADDWLYCVILLTVRGSLLFA
jgi:hypothetical protein